MVLTENGALVRRPINIPHNDPCRMITTHVEERDKFCEVNLDRMEILTHSTTVQHIQIHSNAFS